MSRRQIEPVRKKAGFTLVEVIVSIALIGMAFALAGSFINFSFTSEEKVESEYELQSELRLATELLNQSIRNASVTFVMPGSASSDTIVDEWSYFGTSEDGSEIVHYVWKEEPDGSNGRHEKRVIVSKREGTTYSLKFNNQTKTKLVGYKLELHKEDGRTLSVSSTLAAINSIAVDYNSSEQNPAAVIAYRTDERPKPGEGKKVTIVISMVIDDSGSMENKMDGTSTYNNAKKRKTIMKGKADILIDSFTENVVLGIVRFASDANNPSGLTKLVDESTKVAAKNSIPTNASGGTNTGDGLRRAYYQLKSYVKSSPDEEVLYYIILLTDGNPTYYSHTAWYNKYRYNDRKVAADDYQIDDQNIDERGGTGSSDPYNNSLDYTKVVGERLLRADTGMGIRTFVIGFSGVASDITKARTIAEYCNPVGTDINTIYFEADSEESLGIAFDAIKESMLSEYWHIYGPYGKPEE